MLKNLPTPSERHITALDAMVEDIYTQYGLTDSELQYRQTVVQQIQDIVTAEFPGLSLLSVILYS